ncbi:putative ATP-dependent RNA helicase DDX10, partial [Sigmodon hispidus]
CFVSYIRSVYLMKDKEVFNVSKLPITEYALSLGLAVAPRMSILHRNGKKKKLEDTEGNLASGDSEEQDEDTEDEDMEEQRGKAREPPLGSVLRTEEAPQEGKEAPVQFLDRDEEEEDGPDADFLTVKRLDVFGLELKENEPLS